MPGGNPYHIGAEVFVDELAYCKKYVVRCEADGVLNRLPVGAGSNEY